MRRFVIPAVAILALAAPASAYAKTVTHNVTMTRGNDTGCCVYPLHLAHAGRIQVVFRYSRVQNPKARFIMSLRTPTDPEGNVVLDTGGVGGGCTAAGDFYVCPLYFSGLAAGNYSIALAKETSAAARVRVRLSWPAS
jgi:hypothetical protein